MNAGIFDIYVDQDSDFYAEFEYVDSDDNAINITQNVSFHVRRSSIKPDNLFSVYSNEILNENDELNSGTDYYPGSITVSGNLMTVELDSSVISKLHPGQYFYYILFYGNGNERTFLKGRFTTETP